MDKNGANVMNHERKIIDQSPSASTPIPIPTLAATIPMPIRTPAAQAENPLSLFERVQILLAAQPNYLSNDSVAGGDDATITETAKTKTSTSMAFESERLLAAWVILTRLSQDELDRSWEQYSEMLEKFAINELLSPEFPSLPPGCAEQLQNLYLRLIAQVTSRLSIYPQKLGESLLRIWIDSSIPGNPSTHENSKTDINNQPPQMSLEVHIDVCTSLDAWMVSDPAKTNELLILEKIWIIYSTTCANINIANRSNNDNITKVSNSTESQKEYNKDRGTSDDWNIFEYRLMGQTLSSILEASCDQEGQKGYYSKDSWHELVLAIFQSHGHQQIPDSMIPTMMNSPFPPPPVNSDEALTMAWHEWILTLIQTRVTTSTSFDYSSSFLKDPKTVQSLNKMLLSHIVAPINDSLRAMAWQTITAIGENRSWRWILCKNATSSSSLGAGTALCTWVRMASGELQIQLQQMLSFSVSETPPDLRQSSATGLMQATSILPISNSCARVLMSVVQFCVRLGEEPHRMPLSSDALMHLRHSLEQTLWTLVEYLKCRNDETEAGNSRQNEGENSFVPIAIELFGTLLMEVDIWDLLQKDKPPDQILHALSQALPMESRLGNKYSLIPGLVNIIGDAESNAEKIEQLDSIWGPLFDYLYSYWRDNKSLDDTLVWACTCTELWSEQLTRRMDASKMKRRIAMLLTDWIQSLLQNFVASPALPEPKPYLSLVLGCYMTLSKERERPPTEHESRVIGRALQLCENS